MSIARLPEIVYPLTQVNKVNEIVDTLNDNLNMYYSTTNPTLTPVEGIATWTVTHNLGTENINCSLYNGYNLIISNITVVSENVISVSFNATNAIPADTYKIVVISNGAASSSGGGSYTLPIASTTTLGGVKIDGTSITITNDGVISSTGGSITVDSTLSATSTNPVQNKVLYPSLSKYIPGGTTYNIKADGSGDFATIRDALSFLYNKWSDGNVTITLENGTYTFNTHLDMYGTTFNIPGIIIQGQGVNNTIIETQGIALSTAFLRLGYGRGSIDIRNLTIKNSSGSKSTSYYGISIDGGGTELVLENIAFIGLARPIYPTMDSVVRIRTALSISESYNGLISGGGTISSEYMIPITFNNCNTAVTCWNGGIIKFYSNPLTFTSVTTQFSQTPGTATTNGWITGSYTAS